MTSQITAFRTNLFIVKRTAVGGRLEAAARRSLES